MKMEWNNLSLIPKRLVAPITAILLWWASLAQANYVLPDSPLQQTRRAININATSHHVQVAENRFTTSSENYIDTAEAPRNNSAIRKILLRRRISDTTDDNVYSQQVSRSSSDQWSVLHLIVQAGNFFQSPSGTGTNPGDTVVGNNNIFNARNQVTGYAQLSCIRATNFVCTWTIFSASIATSGCDIYIQGTYIPANLKACNTPVLQTGAIVGGTGPCRGITGEAQYSIRGVPQVPPILWDYVLFYRIPS